MTKLGSWCFLFKILLLYRPPQHVNSGIGIPAGVLYKLTYIIIFWLLHARTPTCTKKPIFLAAAQKRNLVTFSGWGNNGFRTIWTAVGQIFESEPIIAS